MRAGILSSFMIAAVTPAVGQNVSFHTDEFSLPGSINHVVPADDSIVVVTDTMVGKLERADDGFSLADTEEIDCIDMDSCQIRGVRTAVVSDDGNTLAVVLGRSYGDNRGKAVLVNIPDLTVLDSHPFPSGYDTLDKGQGEIGRSGSRPLNKIYSALHVTEDDMMYFGSALEGTEHARPGIFRWDFSSGELHVADGAPEFFEKWLRESSNRDDVSTNHQANTTIVENSRDETLAVFDSTDGSELGRFDIEAITADIRDACYPECRVRVRTIHAERYRWLFGLRGGVDLIVSFAKRYPDSGPGYGVVAVREDEMEEIVGYAFPRGYRVKGGDYDDVYENDFLGIVGNSSAFCTVQTAGIAGVIHRDQDASSWFDAKRTSGGVDIRSIESNLGRNMITFIEDLGVHPRPNAGHTFSMDNGIVCADVSGGSVSYLLME